jgi:dGTPase
MEWKKLLNHERVRSSPSEGDHRAQFERDFDRAIFSNPVKRLQDKAQVFPLDPCDAIRTRLCGGTIREAYGRACVWLL